MPEVRYSLVAHDNTQNAIARAERRMRSFSAPRVAEISIRARGIEGVKSALGSVKEQQATVTVRESGIAQVKAAVAGISDEEVDVTVRESGIAEVQAAIAGISDDEAVITLKAAGIADVQSAIEGIPDDEAVITLKAAGIADVQSAIEGIPDDEAVITLKAAGIADVQSAIEGIPDDEAVITLKAAGIADVQSAIEGIPDDEAVITLKAAGIADVQSAIEGIPDDEAVITLKAAGIADVQSAIEGIPDDEAVITLKAAGIADVQSAIEGIPDDEAVITLKAAGIADVQSAIEGIPDDEAVITLKAAGIADVQSAIEGIPDDEAVITLKAAGIADVQSAIEGIPDDEAVITLKAAGIADVQSAIEGIPDDEAVITLKAAGIADVQSAIEGIPDDEAVITLKAAGIADVQSAIEGIPDDEAVITLKAAGIADVQSAIEGIPDDEAVITLKAAGIADVQSAIEGIPDDEAVITLKAAGIADVQSAIEGIPDDEAVITLKAAGIADVQSAIEGIPDDEAVITLKAAGIADVQSAIEGIPDDEAVITLKAAGIADVQSAIEGIPDDEAVITLKAAGVQGVKDAIAGIPDEDVAVTVKAAGIAGVREAIASIPDDDVSVTLKPVWGPMPEMPAQPVQMGGGMPGGMPGLGMGGFGMARMGMAGGGIAATWMAVKQAQATHGEAADVQQMEAHLRASLREEISDEQLGQLSQRALDISGAAPVSQEDVLLLMATLARNNRTFEDLMSPVAPGMISMALSTSRPGLTPEQAITQGLGMSGNIATDALDIFGMPTSQGMDIANLVTGFTGTSKGDLSGFGQFLSNAGSLANAFGLNFEDFVTAGSAAMPQFQSAMDMGTSAKVFFQRSADFGLNNYDLLKERGMIAEGSERYDEAGKLTGYRTTLVDPETGSAKSIEEIGRILHETFGGLDPDVMTAELGRLYGSDSSRFGLAMMSAHGAGDLQTKRAEIGEFDAIERAEMRFNTFYGAWDTLLGNAENTMALIGQPSLAPTTAVTQWASNQLSGVNQGIAERRRMDRLRELNPDRPWLGTQYEASADFLVRGQMDPRIAGTDFGSFTEMAEAGGETGNLWRRIPAGARMGVLQQWQQRRRQLAGLTVFGNTGLPGTPDPHTTTIMESEAEFLGEGGVGGAGPLLGGGARPDILTEMPTILKAVEVDLSGVGDVTIPVRAVVTFDGAGPPGPGLTSEDQSATRNRSQSTSNYQSSTQRSGGGSIYYEDGS